jgi:4-carboxymuconolactone decarboxylase
MIWRIGRLAPPSAVPDDVEATLDAIKTAGGEPAGTIAVLAHTPSLMGPFLGWAAELALNGTLPKRDHELLAMRASWNCRSAFEWGEHAQFCRRAGLTDEEIERIAAGPDARGWQPHEASLLRAADELHATSTVSDTTWAELVSRYDAAQLVEAVYVVGQYTMLSFVANALDISAPPSLDRLPG